MEPLTESGMCADSTQQVGGSGVRAPPLPEWEWHSFIQQALFALYGFDDQWSIVYGPEGVACDVGPLQEAAEHDWRDRYPQLADAGFVDGTLYYTQVLLWHPASDTQFVSATFALPALFPLVDPISGFPHQGSYAAIWDDALDCFVMSRVALQADADMDNERMEVAESSSVFRTPDAHLELFSMSAEAGTHAMWPGSEYGTTEAVPATATASQDILRQSTPTDGSSQENAIIVGALQIESSMDFEWEQQVINDHMQLDGSLSELRGTRG
ncbi:hypothetical protein KEM52_006590 [Ascosphaera acerosa]|nr:hypothetical protein KEM52_006590 [Ascosphaera acerosa]